MYFDEDGDLAHEFYVEVKEGRKRKMKRVYDNLTPQVRLILSIFHNPLAGFQYFHISMFQGLIKLSCPRLHQDCPVVLYML